MTTSVDKFNSLFNEFIDKIINKYPNQTLNDYKKAFVLLKITSPSTPSSLFMAGCVDYKNQIKNRDEAFFINNNAIKNKINSFSIEIGINKYWKELTDRTKTAIWDYIQSLFLLGELIISNNPTEFNKIRNSNVQDYKEEISNLHKNKFSTDFLTKLNS
tara:strand:- start:13198 stop:13674 length:477 start_codon:yes stop_codon:yes gene_type:complete